MKIRSMVSRHELRFPDVVVFFLVVSAAVDAEGEAAQHSDAAGFAEAAVATQPAVIHGWPSDHGEASVEGAIPRWLGGGAAQGATTEGFQANHGEGAEFGETAIDGEGATADNSTAHGSEEGGGHDEDHGEGHEEHEFDAAAVWMLLGSIVLLVCLFYMMHIGYFTHTGSLKRNTWKLIYMLVSIFIAVMWFQTTLIILEYQVASVWRKRVIADTFVVIWWLVFTFATSRVLANTWWLLQPTLGILSHITGFQLLLLIGELQENLPASAGEVWWPVIAWAAGVFIGAILLLIWRWLMVLCIHPSGTFEQNLASVSDDEHETDEKIDEHYHSFENKSDEDVEEDEEQEKERLHDELDEKVTEFALEALDLASSFTFVRILATIISGELPELFFLTKRHEAYQIAVMSALAISFIVVAIVYDMVSHYFKKWGNIAHGSLAASAMHLISMFLQMTGAWSLILAVRWLVHALTEGVEGDDITTALLDRIIVATCMTLAGFGCTILASCYIQHFAVNRHQFDGQGKGARDLISIWGLCIGFTWELAFELAKEELDHQITDSSDARIIFSAAVNFVFTLFLWPALVCYIYQQVAHPELMIGIEKKELEYDTRHLHDNDSSSNESDF